MTLRTPREGGVGVQHPPISRWATPPADFLGSLPPSSPPLHNPFAATRPQPSCTERGARETKSTTANQRRAEQRAGAAMHKECAAGISRCPFSKPSPLLPSCERPFLAAPVPPTLPLSPFPAPCFPWHPGCTSPLRCPARSLPRVPFPPSPPAALSQASYLLSAQSAHPGPCRAPFCGEPWARWRGWRAACRVGTA